MEQEQDNAGVVRSQNQLHVLPEGWGSADMAIAPMLDRVDAQDARAQLVVVTNDADAAAGVARRLAPAAGERGLRTLAATDARRSARVQRSTAAQVVVGPPTALLSLLQATALKLDGVRTVALAWVDDLPKAESAALEALMSEMPKDSARLVLANESTPAVEQLVERYARRAHRMQPAAAEGGSPVSLSFVTTSQEGRPVALRRILDAVDPESAVVIAREADSRAEVEGVLRSLGYDGRSNAVRVGDISGEGAALVVMYDLPAGEDELRRVAGGSGSGRIVALVTPRQIASLKRLAGGAVAPLSLPEAALRARSREESLRDELREMLSAGQFSRELLAIESLLSDYDGAEIAAAALRLLEIERAKPRSAPGVAGAAQAPMTRLFLNVGEMDGVRAGDLVGAITNEAGISKAELGRVEVRERGSTVEVATPIANTVISKLHGVTIKGRRAFVKVDEDRPKRERSGPGDRPRRPAGRGAPTRRGEGGPRKR